MFRLLLLELQATRISANSIKGMNSGNNVVPVKRNEFNQKMYTRDELKSFFNIQLLKSLNMPLDEIKQRRTERIKRTVRKGTCTHR